MSFNFSQRVDLFVKNELVEHETVAEDKARKERMRVDVVRELIDAITAKLSQVHLDMYKISVTHRQGCGLMYFYDEPPVLKFNAANDPIAAIEVACFIAKKSECNEHALDPGRITISLWVGIVDKAKTVTTMSWNPHLSFGGVDARAVAQSLDAVLAKFVSELLTRKASNDKTI